MCRITRQLAAETAKGEEGNCLGAAGNRQGRGGAGHRLILESHSDHGKLDLGAYIIQCICLKLTHWSSSPKLLSLDQKSPTCMLMQTSGHHSRPTPRVGFLSQGGLVKVT